MASHLTSVPGNPPKVLESSKFKVRRDIAETTQDVIPTSTSLPSHQDRSLHFKLDPAANKCINLSLMKLHLKYRVVDQSQLGVSEENRPKLPSGYGAIVPGNPLASIFKDVKIKLNGTPVTGSNELYPWISKHLYMTKVAPVYRKAAEVSGRVYYDTEDLWSRDYLPPNPKKSKEDDKKDDDRKAKVAKAAKAAKAGKAKKKKEESTAADQPQSDAPNNSQAPGIQTHFSFTHWKDMDERMSWYDLERPQGGDIDLCNYLFTDLTVAPTAVIIPPDVTVEIELQPNNPGRAVLVTHQGFDKDPKPVVEILSAEIIVPRILPNGPTIPDSITHQFMAVNAQQIFIPKGSTNYHGVVTFPGPLPSRLSVVFASRSSYDGDHASNMYNSQAYGVESISFNAGGTQYPSAPLSADPDRGHMANMYLRTAESLRFSLDKTQMSLPKTLMDYKSTDFIYSADISPDYSADSTWTTRPEQGSVAVNMHFGQPTNRDIVAIVISESVATLNIRDAKVELFK
jgi:hypothetical protein